MTDNQKILKLIKHAAKEGWTELDLNEDQLSSLLSRLTNLTSLDLRLSVSAFSNDINQRVKPLIRVNLGISKSCKSYFILRKPFFVAFKSYFVAHLGIHQDLVLFAELTAGAQTCRGE